MDARTPPTADLMDACDDALPSCETPFRPYGALPAFHGRIRTALVHEDNALVRAMLATPGDGAVLVVDGGGSLRTALLGDRLASLAIASGWAGLVINGAVRDVAALALLPIGIKALGSNPRRSAKAGAGRTDVPVAFGGVTFAPGGWLYSDQDGIVLSGRPLH